MNYIIFGAGKTAYTIKRFIENCRLEDKVIGFYDFYNNNPFNLNIVSNSNILNHNGKFIFGTIMNDSIISMRELAKLNFGIQESEILQINEVLEEGNINFDVIQEISQNFDNTLSLYLEVIKARSSFNFNYFLENNFSENSSEEYYKYDLIKEGDVLIDGGSFDGSTAMGFSKIVGDNGFVYSFDCDLENIFPEYKRPNIKYFDFALYDSERTLNFHKYLGVESPGSFVSEITEIIDDGLIVKAISLDDFNNRIMQSSKIDFIKMDIEGAELKALQGSRNIILRDKPKLAIACYHVLEHYWEIPQLVLSIDPTYRIGFDHYSDYFDGSVLYFY
jgi:FkbM family methyltransferase